MCGICGWAPSAGTDKAVLNRMMATLAHRGPDDAGAHVEPAFAFGHTRLAVIDPGPAGRQPLVVEHADRRVVIVLNGEIYDYRTHRERLQARGHVFDTGTDTEVLARALLEWGADDTLRRIDGMFAFAAWDGRQLVLARDRMGEKPLYYAQLDGGRLVFGSELRAVLAHPDVDGDVDPVSLRKYLTYDYVPAPRSIVRGVQKLEPGCALALEILEGSPDRANLAGSPDRANLAGSPDGCGRLRRWRYADLPRPTATLVDPYDAKEALWSAIESAVESRLVSDVPLGCFLSGGLDSTAIAVAASRLAGRIPTFCVGFDDPSFDESGHARAVAEHLGTDHHETRLTADELLDLLPGIVGSLDEPLADPSVVPTHLLARFARSVVTVALGGDGGDELLLGYPTFGAHRLARAAAAVPGGLRRGLLEPALARWPASEKNWSLDYRARRFLRGLDYGPLKRHFVWIGGLEPAAHAALLMPDVFAAGAGDPLDDVERLLSGREPAADPLDDVAYLYTRLYLAEGVLQKLDRATMAYGLEGRSPLLAPGVVATAARIPTGTKLRRGVTKWVLRQALKGRVPTSILERPKKGFGLPLTAWLKGPLRPLVEHAIDARTLREEGLFQPAECRRFADEHFAGRADHRKVLWSLIVFRLWRDISR